MSKGICFIYAGPELGEKQDAITAIRNKLTKTSGSAPEEHRYYVSETDVATIVNDIQNASLFCDTRLFTVFGADEIKKKDDISIVCSCIKSIPDDTVLLLITDTNGVDKKIEQLLAKDNKVIFWELFENRKSAWIRDFLGKTGYKIDNEAIEAILELVENNTDSLRQELGRFPVFFEAGSTISLDDVEKVLSHTRQESAFTLFSAIAEQDMNRAIDIVQTLLASKEAPVQILAGLNWCFKRLQDYLSLKDRNLLNDFELKKVGITTKRAQADYLAASRQYTSARCRHARRILSDYDIQLRSGAGPLEKTRMEVLVVTLLKPELMFAAS